MAPYGAMMKGVKAFMESLLEQLYDGNIRPAEKHYPQNKTHKKLIDACLEKNQAFRDSLPPELLRVYDDVEDANLALAYENNRLDFVDGFRLGARIMIQILEK